MKNTFKIIIFFLLSSAGSFADQYPNTSVGIIDINRVLTESKASLDASKQIEKIQKKIEDVSKEEDESIIKEREKLIEQQSIMAPEAFEVKVAEFEKRVQSYQIERQDQIQKLDKIVQDARSKILEEVKPILKEYSNELGITVVLEKNSIILSADDMDMTDQIIKKLNKVLPKIKVEYSN
jgi:Skp family chaperone for outer membrane proteins